jgi:cytochrome c oxidase subunit 1
MATLAHEVPVTAHHTAKKKPLIWDLMTTVDHKKIGILYGVSALFFMLVGGIEASMIRIQLMRPENTFVSAQTYNSLFTMHGTTMVFMVGMPIAVALFNFIVPL